MREGRRFAFGAACAIVAAWCSTAAALPAQVASPWRVHVDAGFATIHGVDASVFAGAGVARALDPPGVTRLTGEVGWGSSDDGFGFLEGGLEWHPPPIGPLDPFLHGGVGLLTEPEFTGLLVRVGVGFDVKLSPRAALRFQGRAGAHGGEPGPNGMTVGVALAPG